MKKFALVLILTLLPFISFGSVNQFTYYTGAQLLPICIDALNYINGPNNGTREQSDNTLLCSGYVAAVVDSYVTTVNLLNPKATASVTYQLRFASVNAITTGSVEYLQSLKPEVLNNTSASTLIYAFLAKNFPPNIKSES